MRQDDLLKKLGSAKCESEWPLGKRWELRGISRAVNEFRNDSWAQILRARNQLIVGTAMLGLAGYVLLLVALALHPPRATVITAVILFAVGAIVGLLNLALSSSEKDVAMEDYGLSFARSQFSAVSAGSRRSLVSY